MPEPDAATPTDSCEIRPQHEREITLPAGVTIDYDTTAQGRVARASVLPATDPRIAAGAVSGGLFVLLQNQRRLLVDATMLRDVSDIQKMLTALLGFFPRTVLQQRLSFQLSPVQAGAPKWRECLADYEVSYAASLQAFSSMPARWLVIPAMLIRNRCRPLGAEWARQILPGHRLLVADYGSPVVATLDLNEFIDSNRLCTQSLQQAVFDTVVAADACHDSLHWPTARAASDSYLQRRIVLLPQNAATLIQRDGPAVWREALRRINEAAAAASLALAHSGGAFPAMQSRQVLLAVMGREDYASWVHRWRAQTSACRYRNRQLVAVDLADWWLNAPMDEGDLDLAAQIVATADMLAFGRQWPELCRKAASKPEIVHSLRAVMRRRELATA